MLGVVEGVTEFLPISSTGHLILASTLLGVEQTEFAKTFEIAIQSGAILAVLVLYARLLTNWPLMKKIAAAFIPTALIGYVLYVPVKAYLLGNEWVVLGALFFGGIALIAFEKWHGEKDGAKDLASLSYTDAALIGIAQSVAVIPGVSRSAATVLGGLALNLSRVAIVEFSFLLAVPTLLAATALDLLKTGGYFSPHEWFLLGVGFAVSFVISLAAIRWLISYVRGHSFVAFGVYRIVLSLAFAAFLLL